MEVSPADGGFYDARGGRVGRARNDVKRYRGSVAWVRATESPLFIAGRFGGSSCGVPCCVSLAAEKWKLVSEQQVMLNVIPVDHFVLTIPLTLPVVVLSAHFDR